MKTTPRAFTLIELLVVLAIIGVLAGLLFPAVNGALNTARKAQAKNDAVQIATAITAYETEYGRLPLSDKTSVDQDLVEVLIGDDTNVNPRRIPFIEVKGSKGTKSGTNSDGDYVDPWGNIYQIVMDGDYDQRINVTAGTVGAAGSETIELRKKVAVFNFASSSGEKRDDNYFRNAVRSWE